MSDNPKRLKLGDARWHQWLDVSHWHLPLRQMLGRDDAAHRQGQRGRPVSLLQLPDRGRPAAQGRSTPMDRLDHLVASHLEERLRQLELPEAALVSVLDRRQERAERTSPNSTGAS